MMHIRPDEPAWRLLIRLAARVRRNGPYHNRSVEEFLAERDAIAEEIETIAGKVAA